MDALLQESVEAMLSRSNYNDRRDVVEVLKTLGIPKETLESWDTLLGELDSMSRRRHRIVHRADANVAAAGTGNYAATSLNRATVKAWRGTVTTFVEHVVAAVT